MNVFLIGGASSFINNLIIKLKKEGHRVYLLTGSRYDNQPYQKVFEKYNFGYDSTCLNEIFESIHPDLTIFAGAYDTNFDWKNEEEEAVKYSSRMMNILMSYVMAGSGRFIYLSSDEVFAGDYREDIPEETAPTPKGYKSMVLTQAEEMCDSYRRSCEKDIITLRLDHMYVLPERAEDATDICCKMVTEALYHYTISADLNHTISMLYATDAIELIYRIADSDKHQYHLYNISSGQEVTEGELAEIIKKYIGFSVEIISTGGTQKRTILSTERFRAEFHDTYLCDFEKMIKKVVDQMKRYRRVFLYGEKRKKTLVERILDKAGWLVKLLIPFFENLLCFGLFYFLNIWAADSRYFTKLDFYLFYVLIFAIVYGQQQATLSATLSVAGYIIWQMSERSGFEVMIDSSTYVWIAQLFIIGLAVGYMRDSITKMRREQEVERDYLALQLRDIKDINDSNVRVKDALETQIINQSDSVGKIYSITSALDQYSPEEVLFYAADIIAKLMKSKDVSVYTVSNADYARLFSSTSVKARALGNSIRYRELGELYETIMEHKVFINRRLTEGAPLMANGIFDDFGNLQTIIFIWTIPWESMTLGQANQLVVASALIYSAVSRANRYLKALESERYIAGTKMLEESAFSELSDAYVKAERKGLTDCMILKVLVKATDDIRQMSAEVAKRLRLHDYVGLLEDGSLGVLLSNTNSKDSEVVIKRIEELGYSCEILEGCNE